MSSFGAPPPKPPPSSSSAEDSSLEEDHRIPDSRGGGGDDDTKTQDQAQKRGMPMDPTTDYDENTPDTTKFVPCDGRCPGACGNDGSFYQPHDRFEDKQRDKQEFPTFTRKIPPIGVKYDEFDEDPELAKIKDLPCRGPDHVTNGPCTCEKELAIRSKNKAANEPYFSYLKSIQQVAPFGFIKKEIPKDAFPAGLRVDVGDMVDLLSKTKGSYEVRLCDGSGRKGNLRAEAIHVIEDVRTSKPCCNHSGDKDDDLVDDGVIDIADDEVLHFNEDEEDPMSDQHRTSGSAKGQQRASGASGSAPISTRESNADDPI